MFLVLKHYSEYVSYLRLSEGQLCERKDGFRERLTDASSGSLFIFCLKCHLCHRRRSRYLYESESMEIDNDLNMD